MQRLRHATLAPAGPGPAASASASPRRTPRLARWLLVFYWPALILGTHLPEVPEPDLAPGLFPTDLVPPDKAVHLLGYAGLTLLLVLAAPLGRAVPRPAHHALAAGVALAFAVVDEWTQPWVGRSFELADMTADALGILWVYLTAAARPLPRFWRWPVWGLRCLVPSLGSALIVAALLPQNYDPMQLMGQTMRLEPPYDKEMHFYLAMGLTWLIALCGPAGLKRARLGAFLTMGVMIVSAPVIELIQLQVGRGADPDDIVAHAYGVAVAGLVWLLVTLLRPAVPAAGHFLALALGFRAGRRADEERRATALAGHAGLISGLTLLSRATGLVRDATLAAIFGMGVVADAFFIGFLVPNLFRRLFGEGALAAAFIPRYTELRQQEPALARRFAGTCLAGLAVVLAGLTLAGEALLYWLWGSANWAAGTGLAIRLIMLMLPYMPLVCLVALLGAILQVHRRFGPPAAVPIALNLGIIVAALGAGLGMAGDLGPAAVARVTALAILAAGLLQLLWQGAAAWVVARPQFRLAGSGPAVRDFVKAMGPLALGLAVFQINAFTDSLIALFLAAKEGGAATFTLAGWRFPFPMQAGAVAALQWSQRLQQFPLGVFGIAVATAIFPALSEAAADEDRGRDRLRSILQQGLRLTLFIGLPATVGLFLVRLPLARVIYERGAFTLDDAQRVATILAGYASAVWAYSLSHVLTRAFYAAKRELTPVRVAASTVVLNLALNLTLIWPLGAAGLAWSTAICAALQAGLLLVASRRLVGPVLSKPVLMSWLRTTALTVAMAMVVGAIGWHAAPAGRTWWETAGWLGAMVLSGALVVFLGGWLTGAPELRWLGRRSLGEGEDR
jgi:putative peptidoglycan lipid II flippase